MSEWQPIETAPKDGTLILLTGHDYNDTSKPRHYVSAWWSSAYNHFTYEDSEVSEIYTATHWRPLPEPPTQS